MEDRATDPAWRMVMRNARREARVRRAIEVLQREHERRPSVRLARFFDKSVAHLQHCIRKAVGCIGGGP